MKVVSHVFACCICLIASAHAILAQGTIQVKDQTVVTADQDFIGDWYVTDIVVAGFQQAKITRDGDKYRVHIHDKDWMLSHNGNVLESSQDATIADIQKTFSRPSGFGSRPLTNEEAVEALQQQGFKYHLVLTLEPNMFGDGLDLSEKYILVGQPYIYNGSKRPGTTVPGLPYTWERKPQLSSSLNWSEYVTARKGYVDFPFRELYKQEIANIAAANAKADALSNPEMNPLKTEKRPLIWLSSLRPEVFSLKQKTGHEYLCISSLGVLPYTLPDQAMTILKNNIESLFPDGAKGLNGSKIEREGDVFNLRIRALTTKAGKFITVVSGKIFEINPQVRAKDIEPTEFTFEALATHPLAGTARHGIFRDITGELFLYQQGRGNTDESWFSIGMTYTAAPNLWRRMADNLKQKLEQEESQRLKQMQEMLK